MKAKDAVEELVGGLQEIMQKLAEQGAGKLKGRLLYMGWFNRPWKLVMEGGAEIDLWPIIDKFLVSLNGKRANHERTRDGYTLSVDESSEFRLEYVTGQYVFLQKTESFGKSNVHAYLDDALGWLSGRLVKVEIENGKQIKFTADKSEKVFGVYFTEEGNSCKVSSDAVKTVCRVGQHDCCIFLSACADGFHCEKFNSPLARMLLDRLAKGTIRASRIGNCAILGRKKPEAVAV